MVLRKRLVVLGMACLMPALIPKSAQASVNLGSSMTAECATADCSRVRFHLSLASDAWVSDIDWRRLAGAFSFLDAAGTRIANSYGADWKVDSNFGSGVTILSSAGTTLLAAPVWFELNMSGVTGASDLTGMVGYTGNAYQNADASGTYYSFEGTVTPEPISMLLMGTGLAAVGAARRRRREEEV